MGDDSSDTNPELQRRPGRHGRYAPVDTREKARAGIQAPSVREMARPREVRSRRGQCRKRSGRERCMEVTCQPLRSTRVGPRPGVPHVVRLFC